MSHTACGPGLAWMWRTCSGRQLGFPDHLGPLELSSSRECVCVLLSSLLGRGATPPGLGTDTKGTFGGDGVLTQPAALPGHTRAWGVGDQGWGVPGPYRNLMFFSDTRTKSTMG